MFVTTKYVFCRDKSILVATKLLSVLEDNTFVATKKEEVCVLCVCVCVCVCELRGAGGGGGTVDSNKDGHAQTHSVEYSRPTLPRHLRFAHKCEALNNSRG